MQRAVPLAAEWRVVVRRIMDTELWVVAACVAAGVVSARALPWGVAIAAIFWAVRGMADRRLSVRTLADVPVALLVALCPITLWVTATPTVTTEQVCRLLLGIALYYALANWTTTPARLRLGVQGVLLASAAVALAAPWVVVNPDRSRLAFIPHRLYTLVGPVVADTVNPNVMAGALVLLLPVVVGLLWFGYRDLHVRERILALAAVVLVGGVLVLTQSRGAFLGAAVAGALLVALRLRHGWLWIGGLLALTAGAVAIAGGTASVAAVAQNPTLGGIDNRVEIWSRALYIIRDYPLTGVGMGGFQPLADTSYPLFLTPPGIPHAHNLFLQVAVDLGLPGLIAWLAVVLLGCTAAWQLYRIGRTTSGWLAGLGAGLLAGQVAMLVHGLTDAVSWGMVRSAVLPWALWGLTMAARQLATSDTALERPSGSMSVPLTR